MKTKLPRKQSQPADSPAITHEAIRAHAHRIFLERGGAPGRELDDWLLAEQELKKGCPPTVTSRKQRAAHDGLT